MKHLIRLTDYSVDEVYQIFKLADEVQQGKYNDFLKGKTVVLFFPSSSIRTRVTFEKGIHMLGGQAILFPADALDKKEDLRDVCGYLNNWADLLIVRHKDIRVLEQLAEYSKVPVINAMTDVNHPCEVLSDLYALSQIRQDFRKDKYLFCGQKGNIGLAWKESATVLGLDLEQCCAEGYEMEDMKVHYNIADAIVGKDIVCTDSLPADVLDDFRNCQVTAEMMERANPGAVLNPCPPFYRGEEVSEDAIASEYFVGYEFKKCLLSVQQAIMIRMENQKEGIQQIMHNQEHKTLTDFIPKLQNIRYGKIYSEKQIGDGSLEKPFRMPHIVYADVVKEFIDEVYRFEKEHPEYGLNDYMEILKKDQIQWGDASMKEADVSVLDSKSIMALILGAIRAERFCEGALENFLVTGCINRWLERLKEIDEANEQCK